jgi:hypothetical protein
MMKRLFLIVIFASLLHSVAAAQDQRPELRPPTSQQDITLPDEMRARLAIERAEGEHRKFLEDVKELSDLSDEVIADYDKRGSLASEDLKKIATIEKRAKRMLGYSGGKEVDDKADQAAQLSIKDAVAQLGDAIGKITKIVMTETRHVVSATLIAHLNEVINLAQFIRHSQK